MRWEDERYVRVYTRNTPDWTVLVWQARFVFYELARNADRSGFVAVGKSGMRGLAGVLLIPVEIVEAGIAGLLEDGCVIRVDGGLLIRNFLEAQETPQSDRARKRSQRERDRDRRLASSGAVEPSRAVTAGHDTGSSTDATSQIVTDRPGSSLDVTSGHAESLCAVPSHAVPSSAVPENPPPPAGAPAREPKAGDVSVPPAPPSDLGVQLADAETLLVSVARHAMLETLHGDRKWAQNASSGFLSSAVRATDVDAAVDAFVTGEAARAPEHPEALARWVRDNIGRYLKRAKQYGDDARNRARRDAEREQRTKPGGPPHSPDAQAVLDVFGPAWAHKKRKAFVPGIGDERHAEAIAERARAAATGKSPWLDVVRWWTRQHLANTERFVVDADHALRTMGVQLTAYGLPKAPAPPPRETPPTPETLQAAPPPPGFASGLGPKSDVLVRRPGSTP